MERQKWKSSKLSKLNNIVFAFSFVPTAKEKFTVAFL